MHLCPTRVLFASLVAAGMFAASVYAGGGQPPAIPSQDPLPVPDNAKLPVPPPRLGPVVRSPNLIAGKIGAQKKDEIDKYADPIPDFPPLVEPGPEMSLGDCIAIAVERHPSIRAALASLAATQAGSQSLNNFGTVGTFISPDLNIRRQQAVRGLAASSAEYQRAYNEVVQDVTRMYYTAVYAAQQETVAKSIIPPLREYIRAARALLDTEPDPNKLEGLTPGKVDAMRIGLREALYQQLRARIGRQQAM
ncbi:MAG TPA: hypothetical protein VLM40_01725, partial [Gemmata sp.]|nr:hypothetical protein [Gemmata sp.]